MGAEKKSQIGSQVMIGANLVTVLERRVPNLESVAFFAQTFAEAFLQEALGKIVAELFDLLVASNGRCAKMLFISHLVSHPFRMTLATPGLPFGPFT